MRLGKFIRMVPHPVMLGFVNGLAIVIFLAQLGQFGNRGRSRAGWQGPLWKAAFVDVAWLEGQSALHAAGAGGMLTMAIIHFLPRLTTAIPSSLVAIVVVSTAGGRPQPRHHELWAMSHPSSGGLPELSYTLWYPLSLGDPGYHFALRGDPRRHWVDRVAS